MEGIYPVGFGQARVGKVEVRKQGLYYRFFCRCQISGDVVCRLVVSCGGKQENLGVVVPLEEGFGLRHMRERLEMLGGTLDYGNLEKDSKDGYTGFFITVCLTVRNRKGE